jgi:hypothetical protein
MGEQMGDGLMDKLLDFERAKVRRSDCLISWKSIAFEIGVSEDTLQRWFDGRGVRLPRWGGRTRSPVFLPRGKIVILKALFFA